MKDLAAIINQLDDRLVFSEFGKLVNHIGELYADYNEIDEADEISRDWIEFSETVVKHLLEMADLSKSLFERVVDEIRKSDSVVSESNLKRVNSITSFWLDITVLSYLYNTIKKSGILSHGGTAKRGKDYYKSKQHFDDLVQICFTQQEFFTIESRKTLLNLLKLEQMKKRISLMQESEEEESTINELLVDYDRGQALFLFNDVRERIARSTVSWWWKDPIAMHASVEHVLFHLQSVKNNIENISADRVMVNLAFYQNIAPTSKLLSNVYLAQHYAKLGVEALKVGSVSTGGNYFTQAANLISEQGEKTMYLTEHADDWSPFSIVEMYEIYKITGNLAFVTSTLLSLIKQIKDRKFSGLDILIDEAKNQVKEAMELADMPYISSIALMLDTILVYMSTKYEKFSDEEVASEVVSFVENRLEEVSNRLQKAVKHVSGQWIRAVNNNPQDTDQLTNITTFLELLAYSSYVFPMSEEFRHNLVSEIDSIQIGTQALIANKLANEEFGSNPVKEMVIRAKAFKLCYDAIKCCTVNSHDNVLEVMNQVLFPLGINAFLRGLIAEIQLRVALLQYEYVNGIAELIANSNLSAKPSMINTFKFDKTVLEEFKEKLTLIAVASEELVRNKAPIQIRGSGINWIYFEDLGKLFSGLSLIIDILISAMEALQDDELTKKERKIELWGNAEKLAYQASEIIGNTNSADGKKIGEGLFSIAQSFNNVENMVRDGEKVTDFPLEFFIEIISSIIMSA